MDQDSTTWTGARAPGAERRTSLAWRCSTEQVASDSERRTHAAAESTKDGSKPASRDGHAGRQLNRSAIREGPSDRPAYMSTRLSSPSGPFFLFFLSSCPAFLLFDRAAGFLPPRPRIVQAGARRCCQGWPLFSGHTQRVHRPLQQSSTTASLLGRGVDYTLLSVIYPSSCQRALFR
jgi:hypothetical protein